MSRALRVAGGEGGRHHARLSLWKDGRNAFIDPNDRRASVKNASAPERQRLRTGLELVPLTGEMLMIPGLPRHPAVRGIRLMPDGTVKGLMQNDA